MGRAIQPGEYYRRTALNDIAPTIASLQDIEIPSGSTSRILEEAIRHPGSQ